nr:sulfatase-like hydrolase/transferase [Novipirellula artificiosorum]
MLSNQDSVTTLAALVGKELPEGPRADGGQLASLLKDKGYTTGHFGKWHLGTLSRTQSSKRRKASPSTELRSAMGTRL